MKIDVFKNIAVAAAIIVPFDSTQWQDLKFSKIPSNKVTFSKTNLTVSVEKSASPLIFPLKKVAKLAKIEVQLGLSQVPGLRRRAGGGGRGGVLRRARAALPLRRTG